MIITPRDAEYWATATLIPELAHWAIPFRDALVQEIELRDYQLDLIRRVVQAMLAGYRRILVVLPTGGGKTVMAAAMLYSASALGFPSQFIVHRKELIEQTSKTFAGNDLNHSFVAAGKPFDPAAAVLLAGVQTLANRLDLVLPPNTAIIDEAHHATAATWRQVMDAYGDGYIVGLTATPQRLDGQGLGDHFDVMIEGPTTAELIEWGYLSPFDYYAPSTPDLSSVPTRMGEFAREALAAALDKPKLIGDIVEHYLRLAKGEQGIVFAASREHSRHLADAFRGEGVRAAHVDGDMSDKERAAIDAAFRAGDLDMMTNVDLFGEGYDVPGVVYCGLGRPTKSVALHLQQCGRDLRVIYGTGHDLRTQAGRIAAIASGPKPKGIICDHAGNANRHGLPDQDRTWTLEGRPKGSRATGCNDDATPIRQCLVCFRVVPSVVAICPGCDTPFPRQVRELKQEAGELKKIAKAEHAAEMARRKAELRECKTLADFEAFARKHGYKNPEAWASLQKSMRRDYARFRRR